ncbi:hypothetical protein DV096_11275 [Bradymonadaceae bacterium TMQ3]|nr:hypothetical protein DV096_11275 [Bradymonadaceae bacterium TMQ3]
MDIKTDADLRRFQRITEVIDGTLWIIPQNISLDCIELPNLRRVDREVQIASSSPTVKTINLPVLQKTGMITLDESGHSESVISEVYIENLTHLERQGFMGGIKVAGAENLTTFSAPRLSHAGDLSFTHSPLLSNIDVSSLQEGVTSMRFASLPSLCYSYVASLAEQLGLSIADSQQVWVSDVKSDC